MDWIEHDKICSDAAVGQWLMETIGESMGLSADRCDEGSIKKALFKGTDCGAFVHFDELGVVVGTIVEGSDAEYSKRILFDLDDKESFLKCFWDTVQKCEDFAEAEWAECEAELGDELC